MGTDLVFLREFGVFLDIFYDGTALIACGSEDCEDLAHIDGVKGTLYDVHISLLGSYRGFSNVE